MDLSDVYAAFTQTKAQCDEENMKIRYGQIENKYQFGQVVLKNNLPCYKIEQQGRITCYLSLLDRKINK